MELKTLGIDQNTIELIKHFESLHDGDLKQVGLQPKMCPALIWTVGYGHALRDPKDKTKFLKGALNKAVAYSLMPSMTEKEAEDMLAMDLKMEYLPILKNVLNTSLVNIPKLTPNQLGALLSFSYNCGTHYKTIGGIKKPFAIWENIKKWQEGKMSSQDLNTYWMNSVIKGGGKVLAGLVRRRKSEAHLFLNNQLNFFQ